MNLKEITERAVDKPFSTDEISFVIEQYLSKYKGINIKVNVENTIHHLPQNFHILYMQQNLPNILRAFDLSRKYFNETQNY